MKDKILKVYKTGNEAVRQALESEFGKDFFTLGITERIKTYEDALKEVATKRPRVLREDVDVHDLTGDYAKAIKAGFRLMVITEALNEGWTPNWNDTTQRKWFPWHQFVGEDASGGLGCVGSMHSGSVGTVTAVGFRLCFSSKKLAEYAGSTFKELYQDYYHG